MLVIASVVDVFVAIGDLIYVHLSEIWSLRAIASLSLSLVFSSVCSHSRREQLRTSRRDCSGTTSVLSAAICTDNLITGAGYYMDDSYM
jgi:hypothetical protein